MCVGRASGMCVFQMQNEMTQVFLCFAYALAHWRELAVKIIVAKSTFKCICYIITEQYFYQLSMLVILVL